MSGAKMPNGLKLDGVSLLLVFEGGRLGERTVFWRHQNQWAARKGPWKLLGRGENQQLYNLGSDIGEKNDVAQERPDLVAAMRAEFLVWEKDVTGSVKWVRK